MQQFIIYWALVVAPSDLGRVEEVFQTIEPCQVRAKQFKDLGFVAECIPTTHPEILKSENQLKHLSYLLYGNSNSTSGPKN